MKNLIVIFAIIISCPITFASTNNNILDKIENSIFGYSYSDESDLSRVKRIEENVYGKTSSEQLPKRIAKLRKDLSADLIGKEITPKEDTFAEPEDSWVFAKEPVESSKIQYPAIDELEKVVFKKDFKNENIKKRLSQLETKTFNKTYENEDLSTRVDRLKAEIKPKKFMDNKIAQEENYYYNDPIGKMEENYHLDSYGDMYDYDEYNQNNYNSYNYEEYEDFAPGQKYFRPSKNLNISTIEKTLYKQKFENETMNSRLSRVESTLFGTVFAKDSEDARIARLSSAINAQKSAGKYDSNKFGKNLGTAFQIGTILLMVLACIL